MIDISKGSEYCTAQRDGGFQGGAALATYRFRTFPTLNKF